MAELVDALDSKSCSFGSAGSIPASGTKEETFSRESPFFVFKLCKAFCTLVKSCAEYGKIKNRKTSLIRLFKGDYDDARFGVAFCCNVQH